MNDQNIITEKLRDLLFEIQEDREAKFLLCVCDDRGNRREVRQYLISQLRAGQKKVASVPAKRVTGKLLASLLDLPDRQGIDCINLWGIPGMNASATDQLFSELNFHRDAITSLSVPIIVWLSSPQIQRLAAVAPDFWSRRTAVYLFNKPSTKDLLARLFSRKSPTEKQVTSDIHDAFEETLRSEKALASCLRRKGHFSVEVADEHIKRLQSSLDYLAQQCNNKRQLEVALWLWNATQVERILHHFVRNMAPEMQNVYGDVYSDRTELVLYMAEQMPGLLAEYGKLVEEKVRQRKRANLVSFAKKLALEKANKMLEEMGTRENRSVHYLSKRWTNDYDDYDPPIDISSGEDKLVYDLESWLSGYHSKQPAFFSTSEAQLLKALYSETLDPRQISLRLGIKVSEVRKRIIQLEKRVRLYLAAGTNGLAGVLAVDVSITRAHVRVGGRKETYSLMVKDTRSAAGKLKPQRVESWEELEQLLREVFHIGDTSLRSLRSNLVRSRIGSIRNVYVSKASLVRAKLAPPDLST
jgi:hypothetical protein